MRKSKMLAVLELLEDATHNAGDIIAAIVMAGADRRMGTIRHFVHESRRSRSHLVIDRLERRRYYRLFYKMRHDGLISPRRNDDKKVLKITERGAKKLAVFRGNAAACSTTSLLPHYGRIPGDDFMIVSFDIPERERGKRKWIRRALLEMGFYMVQKSFWAGKVVLPASFLNDLRRARILAYVEIFKAVKIGSLPDGSSKERDR